MRDRRFRRAVVEFVRHYQDHAVEALPRDGAHEALGMGIRVWGTDTASGPRARQPQEGPVLGQRARRRPQ